VGPYWPSAHGADVFDSSGCFRWRLGESDEATTRKAPAIPRVSEGSGHGDGDEAFAGAPKMREEQPPKSRDISRAVHLAHARDELAKVVRKLQRAGITDKEIEIAFDVAMLKEQK
jgi:hypothetical protein